MKPRIKIRRTVETLPSGAKVVRQNLVELPELEWKLQAEAVRYLKQMPEYGTLFTIAGDMNAARRSPQEAVKAQATGIAAGDPDLRLYFRGGVLRMIEYKNAKGSLNAAQKARHPLLRGLGFTVEVVKASTPNEAAKATMALVCGWLAENDNVTPRATATTCAA